jgi:hypothetical protein
MTVSFHDPESPQISGRRLTSLLSRWAEAHRLDARQAATIRDRVLTTPLDLGFDWWWRLLDPESGSVFRATAMKPAFGGSPELTFDTPLPMASMPGFMAWVQDEPDYRPYLRLT